MEYASTRYLVILTLFDWQHKLKTQLVFTYALGVTRTSTAWYHMHSNAIDRASLIKTDITKTRQYHNVIMQIDNVFTKIQLCIINIVVGGNTLARSKTECYRNMRDMLKSYIRIVLTHWSYVFLALTHRFVRRIPLRYISVYAYRI